MARIIAAVLGLAALCAGTVLAHHSSATLGTVRIMQPVRAGDTLLQPGTYELRVTGEHLMPLPGQSEDAGQYVEFVAKGNVVARVGAEVMTAEAVAVGTSGTNDSSISRPRVELLKGGDFLRVSASRGGERYLIHLPVASR
jgi:hypothetical protein